MFQMDIAPFVEGRPASFALARIELYERACAPRRDCHEDDRGSSLPSAPIGPVSQSKRTRN